MAKPLPRVYTCPRCGYYATYSPGTMCESCMEKVRQAGPYICSRCNRNTTDSPNQWCQSCRDEILSDYWQKIRQEEKEKEELEARKKEKADLENGVPLFVAIFIIVALFLLIVGSIIAYFRLDAFSLGFFQAIGLWIISVVVYLIGLLSVVYIIVYENDIVKTFRFTRKFDEIFEDILALYDLEELSLRIEDMLAFVFLIVMGLVLFIGAIGLSADLVFIWLGDLIQAFQSRWTWILGIVFVAYTPQIISLCQRMGKL